MWYLRFLRITINTADKQSISRNQFMLLCNMRKLAKTNSPKIAGQKVNES